MENNWKWYEQQNSQQTQQQQPQQQPQQQSQAGYEQYGYGYNNASSANYTPYANAGGNNVNYGGNNGGSGSDGGNGTKPKKFVTMTQMIATVVVAALLFTAAGLAIGHSIGSNNADVQKEASNVSDVQQDNNPSLPTDDKNASEPAETSDPSTKPSTGMVMSEKVAEGEGSTSVVQSCMNSVVSIDIEAQTSGYYWYSQGESETQTVGSGSGVIITSDGYIITNNHVVSGAEKIKVYLQDGTEYEAELVGADSYTDLAVIKIDAENLYAATIGVSGNLMVGDTVYAIGNPLGVLATSVSKGIISGLDREVTIDGQQMTLMQVNASVNPGNSGGGLFNAEGELIGIVNSKASGDDVEGIGFAIPMDTAKGVVTDLMDHGFVTGRPYLGITMQNVAFTTGSYGFFGNNYTTHPQIYSIEAGSAAEAAGLQVNDIILAFDEQQINSSSEISALLYEYSVGDKVTITVQRGSEKINVEVTLGEREK